MKFIIALLLGLITGAAIFVIALVYNPFISSRNLSPLAVTDAQTISLNFSGVAADAIVFTNDGESRIAPFPEKVLQLWEAPIRQTSAMATVLRDARNQAAGFGIKISSVSERTEVFSGQAVIDSVWYVYLPGRGSMLIEQTENHWSLARDIMIPAYRSSANIWKGSWLGNLTSGPGALGTAKATGSSGDFADTDMLAVESLSMRAWRVDNGAVAAEGNLLIELPLEPVDEPELAVELLD